MLLLSKPVEITPLNPPLVRGETSSLLYSYSLPLLRGGLGRGQRYFGSIPEILMRKKP